MSVYNEPLSWIEESINSILNQTYQNFEFIIVVDNPENLQIIQLLNEYESRDARIQIIINSENIGLTKSLNIGMKNCKGKYLIRMDADDISHTERFKSQVEFMENNKGIVASGTSIRKFGLKDQIVHYENNSRKIFCDFTRPNPFLSPIAHPTAIIRLSVVLKHNIQYNESYKTGQDYGLWSDLIFVGELGNLNRVLLDYRISENQITLTRRENQLKVVREVICNHIMRWFKNQNITIDDPMNPYFIKKLRNSGLLKKDRELLDSFIFGQLTYGEYNLYELIKYLILDLSLSIPLKSKLALIKKKLVQN